MLAAIRLAPPRKELLDAIHHTASEHYSKKFVDMHVQNFPAKNISLMRHFTADSLVLMGILAQELAAYRRDPCFYVVLVEFPCFVQILVEERAERVDLLQEMEASLVLLPVHSMQLMSYVFLFLEHETANRDFCCVVLTLKKSDVMTFST